MAAVRYLWGRTKEQAKQGKKVMEKMGDGEAWKEKPETLPPHGCSALLVGS